ncbi:MAG: RodZ domain-containing protein, partial [Bacteroidota bacterium]
LETLGAELKKRRLEKQVSLTDISAETRINQRFLEAMEEGKFSILPQTYVRAFLREYAASVGLSPDDLMKQYDAAKLEGHPQGPDTQPRRTPPQTSEPAAPSMPRISSQLQRTIIFGAIILGAVVVALLLSNSNSNPVPSKPVSEIPFDRVVKETEAATIKIDSVAPPTLPVTTPPKVDSLRLEMFTLDSVWMSILIDGKKTEEYLFPPKRRKTWIARDQFSVTMGNAGGANFQLNGKDLGALGKRGAVLRNAIISESTLRNL